MKTLRRFLALPPADRRLLWEALKTVALCRAALGIVPFERLRRWAAAVPPAPCPVAVEKLAWGVRAAARRVPRATCLVQALALQRLMARAGLASTLEIGVNRDAGGFTAHAWLRHEGRVIIGGGVEGYSPLAAWKSER